MVVGDKLAGCPFDMLLRDDIPVCEHIYLNMQCTCCSVGKSVNFSLTD